MMNSVGKRHGRDHGRPRRLQTYLGPNKGGATTWYVQALQPKVETAQRSLPFGEDIPRSETQRPLVGPRSLK